MKTIVELGKSLVSVLTRIGIYLGDGILEERVDIGNGV